MGKIWEKVPKSGSAFVIRLRPPERTDGRTDELSPCLFVYLSVVVVAAAVHIVLYRTGDTPTKQSLEWLARDKAFVVIKKF